MTRARFERPTVFRRGRFIEGLLLPRGLIGRHGSVARFRGRKAPGLTLSIAVPKQTKRIVVEIRTGTPAVPVLSPQPAL